METHDGVSIRALADAVGESLDRVEAAVADLDRQGLIRRDQQGQVVGSAGLNVEPSRHELFIGPTRFWTWCAYDAIGILAALGSSGVGHSKSPLTGAPIDLHFRDGLPEKSDAVLFLPSSIASRSDGTASPVAGGSVFENWCPQANLFESAAASLAWSEDHRVHGETLSLARNRGPGRIELAASRSGAKGATGMTTVYLIVLGTGSAAQTVAYTCRAAGWSVAIVDSDPFGGTCQLRGCDPKKVLVGVSELVDWSRRMQGKGISAPGQSINWPDLIAFKRTFTEPAPAQNEKSFTEAGMITRHGRARFVDRATIQVDNDLIRVAMSSSRLARGTPHWGSPVKSI